MKLKLVLYLKRIIPLCDTVYSFRLLNLSGCGKIQYLLFFTDVACLFTSFNLAGDIGHLVLYGNNVVWTCLQNT